MSGGDAELVYRQVPPPPTAELVGTTWRLESLIEGRGSAGIVSSAHPARLKLSGDGSFAGTTGCRGLSGEWTERIDEILFTTMSADGNCSENLRAQDGHVVGVLGDGFTASIEGQELTVFASRGDLGLVYRLRDQPGSSGSDDSAPGLAEIVCRRDGSTELLTPSVDARADGVHVRVENQSGEDVSMNGLGGDFRQGVSEAALSVPPGRVEVACWPYSRHGGPEPSTTPLEVTDSQSHWVRFELECPQDDLIGSSISDYAGGSTGKKGDPVDIVRQAVKGLASSDVLERARYPEQANPVVRIIREGDMVGVAGLTLTEEGGYLLESFSSCPSADLRQH